MSELNIPENWVDVELGNILDVRDGTHDSPKLLSEGITFITSKNLKKGVLNFEKCSYISKEDHPRFLESWYLSC